jgi:AraC-like DNA-binding protein
MLRIKELLDLELKEHISMSLCEFKAQIPSWFRFEESNSMVGCNVCLSGNLLSSVDNNKFGNRYKDGDAGVWGSPAEVDILFDKGLNRWLSVSIERGSLEEILGDCETWSNRDMLRMLLDKEQSFARALPAGAGTMLIVSQILHCPFEGKLAHSYRKCKALELFVEELDRHLGLRTPKENVCINRRQVEEAWRILTSNLEEPHTISDLASTIGMSESTLKRSFRKVYGVSIFFYFQQFRMSQARRLLEEGTYNVTDVAFRVGYSHPGHFSRAFRNHFGVPPKDCQRKRRAFPMA